MTWARTILGVCREFGQLPSAVLAEDVGLLRLLRIEALGGGPTGGSSGGPGGGDGR